MAFNPAPPAWIPGWSENGTDISITALTTAFPQMTAAEADATTGDIRKVLYAICKKPWDVWNALAAGDKPTEMTIRNSNIVNGDGNIVSNFTFEFVLVPSGLEVNDE